MGTSILIRKGRIIYSSPLFYQFWKYMIPVIFNRSPSFHLEVSNITHVVTKSFHYEIGYLTDHPHIIFQSIDEVILIIYILKFAETQIPKQNKSAINYEQC